MAEKILVKDDDDDKTPSQEPLVELIEEKPSTPRSQKQAVELLKETKSMALTAEVAADIYRTLTKVDRTLAAAFAREMRGSFKGAVPGNLADNTKPSTPASQKQAVELLKQGGILPDTEKAADYPVLTADVKRDVIKTLLQRKQPKLATWASRNLVVAYPKPKEKKPSIKTMKRWVVDGIAEATDGCRVEPDGVCKHGHPSWLVELGLI